MNAMDAGGDVKKSEHLTELACIFSTYTPLSVIQIHVRYKQWILGLEVEQTITEARTTAGN